MSATVDVVVREGVARAPAWAAFAPFMHEDAVRALIRKALLEPQVALKSKTTEGAELRLQMEDGLGIAGWVKDGDVESASPFVRFGREYEMEIVESSSRATGLEARISATCLGVELTFFDMTYGLGKVSYESGNRRRFMLGAFAHSVKKVAPTSFADGLGDGELALPTAGVRAIVAREGDEPDQFIFQSPVENEPARFQFQDREFTTLPISLAEREGQRLGIDLVVATELLETLDSPMEAGEDIAGVLCFSGFCPNVLFKTVGVNSQPAS
jgi:hypothetical protein